MDGPDVVLDGIMPTVDEAVISDYAVDETGA
jgi:hypothetical protein